MFRKGYMNVFMIAGALALVSACSGKTATGETASEIRADQRANHTLEVTSQEVLNDAQALGNAAQEFAQTWKEAVPSMPLKEMKSLSEEIADLSAIEEGAKTKVLAALEKFEKATIVFTDKYVGWKEVRVTDEKTGQSETARLEDVPSFKELLKVPQELSKIRLELGKVPTKASKVGDPVVDKKPELKADYDQLTTDLGKVAWYPMSNELESLGLNAPANIKYRNFVKADGTTEYAHDPVGEIEYMAQKLPEFLASQNVDNREYFRKKAKAYFNTGYYSIEKIREIKAKYQGKKVIVIGGQLKVNQQYVLNALSAHVANLEKIHSILTAE